MPVKQPIVVMWFRQDLRIADNPAFMHACKTSNRVLPIYILDDENSGRWKMGAASRWWLHESLRKLNESLEGNLCLALGDARSILSELTRRFSVEGVFWNRCYEPWRIKRDSEIEESLRETGIAARSWNGSLLIEPRDLVKENGEPYRVFTPFFKNCWRLRSSTFREPLGVPPTRNLFGCRMREPCELRLLPQIPWYREMREEWRPGETGAQIRLRKFLDNGLKGYRIGRDYPARAIVSRLSPHLHFGEISANQIWSGIAGYLQCDDTRSDAEYFLRELAWREFSYSLLFFNPDLPSKNLNSKFDEFPWREDAGYLQAWQLGRTGYPIVDAGMRELRITGYMHNRVRMIAGSFLVKNLLLRWNSGANWFWDSLVDADLANNSASWQWVAGSGTDAVPYFRIFNPVSQGNKFDPEGAYVRKFCPELSKLPNKYVHSPWQASTEILEAAGLQLGRTYPFPIVDLASSRTRALEAFALTKGKPVERI
ncbi:MAG: deoxyribodipyrimidine photo-lyase [Albidovulum sp.]|nr:deoxyribodipyrimidine photo-lyase [Albidovulum sp.]